MFNPWEWHHAYIGIILLFVGFTRILSDSWLVSFSLGVIGSYIFWDDIIQHYRQRKDPDYESPLHRLYGWFYRRFAPLRWVNEKLDRLLGKKPTS